MTPCDWIGIVTIRSVTRRITFTTGMINRRPGSRMPRTRQSRNNTPLLELLDDPHRQRERQQRNQRDDHDNNDQGSRWTLRSSGGPSLHGQSGRPSSSQSSPDRPGDTAGTR
jgi:hypothetical protein